LVLARKFPFEVPMWVQEVAISLVNRSSHEHEQLVYRYDNAGQIVALTTTQKEQIDENRKAGKTTIYKNQKKEEQPSAQPKGESEGNRATQIETSDVRNLNIDDPRGYDPRDMTTEERKRWRNQLKEVRASTITEIKQIKEWIAQTEVRVNPPLGARVPPWRIAPDRLKEMLQEAIDIEQGGDILFDPVKHPALARNILFMHADVYLGMELELLFTRQYLCRKAASKKMFEGERRNALYDLNQVEEDIGKLGLKYKELVMSCELSVAEMAPIILEALYNRRENTQYDWQGQLDGYRGLVMEKEIYIEWIENQLVTIKNLKGREPEVKLIDLGNIPREIINWADEVINIPDRSREMTQLERRVNQAEGGRAIYYFGVNDDGTLTSENRSQEVSRFFAHFIEEMKDEGYYSHDIELLNEEQFMAEQSAFESKGEIETGGIEYKSTGSHIANLPPPPKLPKFRVIKLRIKRAAYISITDRKLFKPDPATHGPPIFEVETKDVQVTRGILRVSRWRLPCYKEKGFKDYPIKLKEKLRAQDEHDRKSAVALSHTLSAVTTALLMSRQTGDVDLQTISFPRDEGLYSYINQIQKTIIEEWMEIGHDEVGTRLKEASSQIRIIWQTGKVQDINIYAKLFLKYLDLTEPKFNNTAIEVEVDGVKVSPPSYGLCVMGTLGRALPPPPDAKVERDTLETYERFREPNSIPERLEEKIELWACTFFKDMPEPSSLRLAPAGAAGCLERPRGMGGIGTLVSDYYHALKGVNDPSSKGLPNVGRWREKWKEFPALAPGNIAAHQDRAGEFTYALALDLCKDYLEHYETCMGKYCSEPELHFPLIPFGIPERGHKTRVPCLGSGFFNILQQPIREAMFSVIKKDRRCRYRTRGGSRKEDLTAFLRSFERNMLSHSGDLKVSTDNFSATFNRCLIRGIEMTGKLTPLEITIFKAATGSFRMICPDDGPGELVHIQPAAFHDMSVEEDKPFAIEKKFKDLYNKMKREEEPRVYNQSEPVFTTPKTNCINCGKYREKCTCNLGFQRIRNEEKKTPLDWKLPLPGWKKASRMPEQGGRDLPPTQGEGIGFETMEPKQYNWNHEKVVEEYIELQKMILGFMGNENYQTQRGVQMSQAISIATLYSYNLFADDEAIAAGGKGMSNLCGDDSLRTGDDIYIYTYRDTIADLGGVWSKLKDVVGTTGNGIFTEEHFSYGRVHDIPKVRAVARYDNDNIPGWQKALQSANKVEFPRDPGSGETYAQGRTLVLEPYRSDLEELKQFLPLGLPTTLGGLGDESPIHWKTAEALSRLPKVEDKVLASRCLKKVLKCMHSDQLKTKRQWKLDLSIEYPNERTSTLEREIGFHRGTHRWIYLETQRLRSALEAAATLESPAYPVKFEKLSNYQVVRKHLLNLDQVLDLTEGVDGTKLNVQGLIQQCYHYDVPTDTVRNAIGLEVREKLSYQMN